MFYSHTLLSENLSDVSVTDMQMRLTISGETLHIMELVSVNVFLQPTQRVIR